MGVTALVRVVPLEQLSGCENWRMLSLPTKQLLLRSRLYSLWLESSARLLLVRLSALLSG